MGPVVYSLFYRGYLALEPHYRNYWNILIVFSHHRAIDGVKIPHSACIIIVIHVILIDRFTMNDLRWLHFDVSHQSLSRQCLDLPRHAGTITTSHVPLVANSNCRLRLPGMQNTKDVVLHQQNAHQNSNPMFLWLLPDELIVQRAWQSDLHLDIVLIHVRLLLIRLNETLMIFLK